jgi:hypothetical protein
MIVEMSEQELRSLPVSVDLETAGRAFGLGRTKAFELAKVGQFPCKVLKVGIKYRVPRRAILEALGETGILQALDAEDAGAAAAATAA